MDLHVDFAPVFKALGDATRLKIIEMLSCGGLCACDILESFEITQPTLSYHLKILIECGLVKSQKEGTWIRYSNNIELIENIKNYWNNITAEQENCICKNSKEVNKCD
ncbi:metalloregulator ArsR/SmtB family transcription factor [Clostridium boliviensis]|uniref:Metalloregulator ArsR/SmtB family transcription factor n=1 Tax=Clostridium boliviensis TaxID=318465 RepID=A0ABU4GRA1_9CLOT|nr:metalloregulator ArsR/SmtB family transcription factor [Clostridium boliviensis]MDW2800169.1 metalloregulator ArsR/SmtB family transcription factor [Clostridium boliviensis]